MSAENLAKEHFYRTLVNTEFLKYLYSGAELNKDRLHYKKDGDYAINEEDINSINEDFISRCKNIEGSHFSTEELCGVQESVSIYGLICMSYQYLNQSCELMIQEYTDGKERCNKTIENILNNPSEFQSSYVKNVDIEELCKKIKEHRCWYNYCGLKAIRNDASHEIINNTNSQVLSVTLPKDKQKQKGSKNEYTYDELIVIGEIIFAAADRILERYKNLDN